MSEDGHPRNKIKTKPSSKPAPHSSYGIPKLTIILGQARNTQSEIHVNFYILINFEFCNFE